jgi:hypothetical protein
LIGHDGPRAKLCADLVCPDRIKVYQAEGVDVTLALHILEIAQSSHITLIGVVLPIKLRGDGRASVSEWVAWEPKGEVGNGRSRPVRNRADGCAFASCVRVRRFLRWRERFRYV